MVSRIPYQKPDIELQPQYRSPAGYYKWRKYLVTLAAESLYAVEPNPLGISSPTYGTSRSIGVIAYAALKQKAPAIYVSKELMSALLQTNTPPIPDDLPLVLPVVHFMLPLGSFPTEVNGHSVYAITVERCGREKITNPTPGLGNVVFRLVGNSTEIEGYTSVVGSKAGAYGVEHFHGQQALDVLPQTTETLDVCKQMEALAVNLMLLLAYKPDMLQVDPHGSGKPRGFQTTKEQNHRLLPVTWLGKNFAAKQSTPAAKPVGSHASPLAHWRRGHWHTVRYGKGKELQRVDWFQPVYVNPEPYGGTGVG